MKKSIFKGTSKNIDKSLILPLGDRGRRIEQMVFRGTFKYIIILFSVFISVSAFCQEGSNGQKIVDIVWLKDGSRLTGTILKWDLPKGMEFQLATGATIFIPKADINKVMQDTTLESGDVKESEFYNRKPKPYTFKETGWYHTTSGFLNTSWMGGAGIHHAMGYRFNRLLGVGLGTGIETNEFNTGRNIVPIYAEVRGFMLPKKITPYYALKIGYGIALRDRFSGGTAKGGLHFSPELGIRFGAGDVSYYLGIEYKIQNASYSDEFFGGGSTTDRISYRRVEMRTGLLF